MRFPCHLGLLAGLAACSFGSPKSGPDGGDDGGDDGGGSGGDWTVVEVLSVPASGAVAVSDLVLEAGVGYRLRASGTCMVTFNMVADAEYFGFNMGLPMDVAVNIDLGLAVNDMDIDIVRTPRWGTYNPEHKYEIAWPGVGGPIVAQLHDGRYSDNSGSLTLEILARP